MGLNTWASAPSMTEGEGWKADPATTAAVTAASAAGEEGAWEPTLPENFDENDEPPFTGEFAPENVSKHAGDGGCRICGSDSHFARDCPDKRDGAGECYNCGKVGHNKIDCPNPAVERAFTGACRDCGEEGHRAKDCPKRPPPKCRFCQSEDHLAAQCDANRIFAGLSLEASNSEDAWIRFQEADKEKDVEEIRKAMLMYAKTQPDMSFKDLEEALREERMNTYLIAKEQEISDTMTIVNLQGKVDQKYVISIQFTAMPRRKIFAAGWPSSPEENLARLEQAGVALDRGVPKCTNCRQLGHGSRHCPEEKVERSDEITCTHCNSTGHRYRDCPEPRRQGKECRHCGETGHIAKECPTKGPDTCRNCDGEGHAARDCPEPKNMAKMQCRNCDEMGHMSKECPKPTDWSRVECSNCHEKGHSYRRCTKPQADEGQDGSAADDDGWGEKSRNDATAADAAAGGW